MPLSQARQQEILQDIRATTSVANSSGHDAAVLLVSPSFARSLDDQDFMSHLVSALSGSAEVENFHVVSAIVDHVAPSLGSFEPIRGISVLRGHLDDMLPQLWEPAPPGVGGDADAASALTFGLGAASVTLPLAKTPFLNSRPSTLLTSLYDLSGGRPSLAHLADKRSQKIAWSTRQGLNKVSDLGLFAPLVPLTAPRAVTESFGNIVRRISAGSESVPASTELELAVNTLHEKGVLSEYGPGPVSVWAVVTPNGQESDAVADWLRTAPDPIRPVRDTTYIEELTTNTAIHLSKLYSLGGRFYKILSGGGGWGAKKGLLSLDPQHTHFAMSEEEEMTRFMRTMEDSSFTPRGSQIQFFISSLALPQTEPLVVPGISLGVAGEPLRAERQDQPASRGFIYGHFGALSNDALFISGPGLADGETTKLSVDHSRVFAATHDGAANHELCRRLLSSTSNKP
ncbi:hypothetical protein ESCO_000780 [Escovopsis weberi]|uniref:FIST domain-containing protein n=1 Tax=Escovopsis weberi TaxID=150374 RepID=A0A0N0RTG2_ESCWE|nr:hypothetical protein ESCO_000780 [Escovopsis weberi]